MRDRITDSISGNFCCVPVVFFCNVFDIRQRIIKVKIAYVVKTTRGRCYIQHVIMPQNVILNRKVMTLSLQRTQNAIDDFHRKVYIEAAGYRQSSVALLDAICNVFGEIGHAQTCKDLFRDGSPDITAQHALHNRVNLLVIYTFDAFLPSGLLVIPIL